MRLVPVVIGLSRILLGQAPEPLRLEKTIPLAGVEGRIDHMSADIKKQRLFVSALGNNSVEVIDVPTGKVVHSIKGLREPQGVLYVPENNRLFIANRADGSCRIMDGTTFQQIKSVDFGRDADNIRLDAAAKRIYVGYGDGALGILDFEGNKIGDIKLGAHPESFQLEEHGPRIFVNVPDSKKVLVVDRIKSAIAAQWGTDAALANYPMALDEAARRTFIVCRRPAELLVLNNDTGSIVAKLPAAGDCDDVFYDAARKRIYASGGEGAITVFEQQDADHYRQISRIATANGARTSFFSPALRRLFLAVPHRGAQGAAIRVYEIAAQ